MSKSSIQDYVSKHAFFSGLSAGDLGILVEQAEEHATPHGTVLFRQGERADHFYLVKSGCVSVEIPAITGPTLQMQRLESDALLGWSWLIPPYRWHFQAWVEVDSEVIAFDGAMLRARCERDPRFGYELLKRFAGLMSERLDAARRTMIDEWNPAGFA